ncbi:hypothetical protein [Reichenbachiella versicolor]|uniref:hypothetical protein n=1 Tax=Reichenbachiella versicolor TaxID=1821036 RepID=UPI0013A5ACC1|nr:hypothetical protein [Reichenbachiella versicolor]
MKSSTLFNYLLSLIILVTILLLSSCTSSRKTVVAGNNVVMDKAGKVYRQETNNQAMYTVIK